MDSVLVENLREAVDSDGINDDEVMDFYYEKINPYDGWDDGNEDDWRENRAFYEPINKFLTRHMLDKFFNFIFTKSLSDFLLQENKINILN